DPAPSPREGIILPSGSVEATLTKVWARVLHLDEAAIGVLDDFFRLGGHSIRAIRLINEIHSAFGVKMGLREVFDHTSIRQQSALLERKGAQQEPSMPKAGERVDYPASSAQERMFYAHLQDGNSLAHNISGIFEIRGMVDMERLQWAFQALVERHEGLRTHFMLTDHGLVQQISPMTAVQTAITERGPHTFGSGYQDFYADFIRPFDLKAAPLVRVGLFRGEGTYLCIDVHHIICDGISLDILMEDFKRIYLGYPVEPLEFRYVDYACWQKSRIGQASKTYWAKRLSGETPRLDLPRSIGPGYGAAASVQTLDTGGALYDAIREFTAAANVSDYMFFLSVYYLLLHKMTGNTDIIIGTDAAGRSGPECKNIVGTFINILPIRLEANPYGTYEEFLGSLRNTVLEDFEHQDFPYDEMISLAESGGKRGKDPLVTVHFAFANFIEKGIEMEALSFIPVDIAGTQRTQYEWKLEVTAGEGSFKVRFIYSRGYDDETIALMMKYYRNILQTVLHNPSIRVGDIEMESYLPVES
ncbi:MAG TPA: condensation domain-containing protein, partial [Puia sp.]|nr:condensation domain-containing protein [Puia sp.]